jgi:hypothetical protein
LIEEERFSEREQSITGLIAEGLENESSHWKTLTTSVWIQQQEQETNQSECQGGFAPADLLDTARGPEPVEGLRAVSGSIGLTAMSLSNGPVERPRSLGRRGSLFFLEAIPAIPVVFKPHLMGLEARLPFDLVGQNR